MEAAQLLEDIRKPRVAIPMHGDAQCAGRFFPSSLVFQLERFYPVAAEQVIDRITWMVRVPCEPDFRSRVTNRRFEQFKGFGRYGARLVDPGYVNSRH